LAEYIQIYDLGLKIKIIDYRIMLGAYTLPNLENDTYLKAVEERRHCIEKILQESGEQWTSLELWYRGIGLTRADCLRTVLIGAERPERNACWGDGGLVEKVSEMFKGGMEVEICWRIRDKGC
jgi:hypothetical protein